MPAISREKLYELVWSSPLKSLADQLGISDVGLAKICDRLLVPRPPPQGWQEDSTSEWLFPSRIGEARRRMSGPDRKALHAAAQRAGIKKHVTPHVFRHTFGTLLYASTTDPKAVQRLMRHAALKTTMEVYVKDDRPLAEKVNALPAIKPKTQLRVV